MRIFLSVTMKRGESTSYALVFPLLLAFRGITVLTRSSSTSATFLNLSAPALRKKRCVAIDDDNPQATL